MAVITDESSSRLKSLRNPEKKMSKSDPNSKSRIQITDTVDEVMEKCKKAMTDFTSAVTYEPETRPAVANLITLHSLCTGLEPDDICQQNSHLDTARYKVVVGEAVNQFLEPIRTRYDELVQNPDHLTQVLDRGTDKARYIANQTWTQVKQVVGLSVF